MSLQCHEAMGFFVTTAQMFSDSNERTASDASSASMLEEVSQFLVIHL